MELLPSCPFAVDLCPHPKRQAATTLFLAVLFKTIHVHQLVQRCKDKQSLSYLYNRIQSSKNKHMQRQTKSRILTQARRWMGPSTQRSQMQETMQWGFSCTKCPERARLELRFLSWLPLACFRSLNYSWALGPWGLNLFETTITNLSLASFALSFSLFCVLREETQKPSCWWLGQSHNQKRKHVTAHCSSFLNPAWLLTAHLGPVSIFKLICWGIYMVSAGTWWWA
jgi:hypothetical protein